MRPVDVKVGDVVVCAYIDNHEHCTYVVTITSVSGDGFFGYYTTISNHEIIGELAAGGGGLWTWQSLEYCVVHLRGNGVHQTS